MNFSAAVHLPIGFSPIQESTVRPIARVIDGHVVSEAVALTTAVRLSDNEQLEALRRLDQFRQWHSLEEKRYCLVCGTLISGRQIQVGGGTSGNGPLALNCPTVGCNSIPMDWVLPTDEIFAKVELMAAQERKTAALTPVSHGNGRAERSKRAHNGIALRLRNFALRFRGAS